MNMETVDNNFKTNTAKVKSAKTDFYEVDNKNFTVLGAEKVNNDDFFCTRIDKSACVNDKLNFLNHCTSGVRICFNTNSPYIFIKYLLTGYGRTNCDTLHNSAGMDVLVSENGRELKCIDFLAPTFEDVFKEYNGNICDCSKTIEFLNNNLKTIVLSLPIESAVKKVQIGIESGCNINPINPYKYKKPIVFYGSSITMGCCVSRPNNTYPSVISNLLNCDYINLGFSGNACGEPEIAEYISTLDMSAFVLDYDHNAPNPEHLKATHSNFFKIIRKARPNLPIIMLSRPKCLNSNDLIRKDIILQTFLEAKRNGDNNVWFVDGESVFTGPYQELCFSDNVHPNDLGYYKIAETLTAIIKPLLV